MRAPRAAVVPAAFALFAAAAGSGAVSAVLHAAAHPGTNELLIAGFHLLRAAVALAFAFFVVGRLEPRRRAREPRALAACIVASGAVLAFAPPAAHVHTALVLAGEALAVGACVWLLASVLALGRCFGVLPEARGLVTRGPYRVVRHPVYLGEIGACAGLALAAPSPRNALVLALFVAAQLARMDLEEGALARAFPEYGRYAANTPRLIPRPGRARGTRRPAPALLGEQS